jgi:hypothetical protein
MLPWYEPCTWIVVLTVSTLELELPEAVCGAETDDPP